MANAIIFITAFLVSLGAVGVVRKVALRFHIGALPTARKIHTEFKPVLGGVGIFLGLLAGVTIALALNFLSFQDWQSYTHFWVGLFVILIIGLVDDIRGVPPAGKFAGQLIAALLAVSGGCLIEAFYSPGGSKLALGGFGMPFSVLWIMFVINAVNLLDGLDGLAGGISLITTAGFLVLAVLSGNIFLVVVAVALIGAILGFLKYNYRPARIFMGDVGSLMLGYILACFSVEVLKVAHSHQVFFLASLVLMGMPITDTLISFFRRMGRGEHPFKADREHIHHRLINLGLSHLDSVWLMWYFTFLYTILGVLMVVYLEVAGTPLFVVAFLFSIFWSWRLGYLETRRYVSFGLRRQETEAALRPPINPDRIWHRILLLCGDAFTISLTLYLTFWFRFHSGILDAFTRKSLGDYLADPVFLVVNGFWLLLFGLNGLYRMPWDISRFDQFTRVTKTITFGTLFIMLLLNLDLLMGTKTGNLLNRTQISTLIFYWIAMIVVINTVRTLIIVIEKRFHIFEYTLKKTLVIGATRKAKNIIRDIEGNPHLIYHIVGVVERKPQLEQFEGYPVLGDYRQLPQLIHEHKIEEIIVAVNETAKEDLLNIIGICDRLQVVVKTPPGLQAIVSGKAPQLAGHALMRVFPENMALWQWIIKRLIDIVFAAGGMLLLAPLWIPLAVWIKLRFKKGVIVKVPILGKNGRIFNMYLFRMGEDSLLSNAVYQGNMPEAKLPLPGDFLFRTRLYKLPGLFNILRDDMSLVGPRPESPEWYRQNQHKLRFLQRRVMARPGITGMAQVKSRFEYSQKMLEERIKYDLYYNENISLNLDVRIILLSFFLLFRKPANRSLNQR